MAPAEERDIAGTSTVFVMNTMRYFTSVGVAVRGRDMSDNPPEILVPNGNTFTRITGTPYGGGYRFLNVPEREYYLKSWHTYIVTDERHVELGSNRLGRADTVRTDYFETPLELDLTNLAPWRQGGTYAQNSRLHFVSGNLGVAGAATLYDLVAQGATSMSTTNAEMYHYAGDTLPVFEAAKGDELYVTQLSGVSQGMMANGQALTAATIVRSLEFPALDFTANGATPLIINGAMQEVPLSNVSLEWRLGAYAAHASAVHPNAAPRTPTFSIEVSAHGPDEGWVGYSGEVFTAQLPQGASFTLAQNLKYGNPYPSHWRLLGSANYTYSTAEVLPVIGGAPRSMSGAISVTDYLDNLVISPIAPTLTPPRSLAIDGIPATSQRVVGNSSPVISWQPPANGAPTAYRVDLISHTSTHSGIIKGTFYLSGTESEVRIPAGTLESGTVYNVRVVAIDGPNAEVTREPHRSYDSLPMTTASAITSFFNTP
ncbi:putative Ig-like domain (group 1) [Myxococcus hansupus]|uniref:Putative Ig-like domain (Group 1) n=1 Tax=Pseudomyxococcus hansupus TaxID=1297742 RepID=A0A0H4X6B1_9BACT|nr:putative Ig-like domain (group 1) [Myxococcus hansupus]